MKEFLGRIKADFLLSSVSKSPYHHHTNWRSFRPVRFPHDFDGKQLLTTTCRSGYPKGIVGAAFADRNPSSYVKPAGI